MEADTPIESKKKTPVAFLEAFCAEPEGLSRREEEYGQRGRRRCVTKKKHFRMDFSLVAGAGIGDKTVHRELTMTLSCKRFAAYVCCALLLAAPVSAKAGELVVSAAASLVDAFRSMEPEFLKAQPGVKIVFNFAASGPLLKQIEAGAPVDVFFSADQKTIDQALDKKLLDPASVRVIATNALVAAAPVGSAVRLESPGDLAKPEIQKIAVGNPETVPAGRYTQAVLKRLGLEEILKPKFIPTESVRQALDYAARGEVDLAFVYRTDANIAKDKVKIVLEVPTVEPVVYPGGVVSASANKDLAKAFQAFVLSARGAAILAAFGFGAP